MKCVLKLQHVEPALAGCIFCLCAISLLWQYYSLLACLTVDNTRYLRDGAFFSSLPSYLTSNVM